MAIRDANVSGTGKKTWDLDSFSGGIDNRMGIYSRDQKRMRVASNVLVNVGGKIERRPACELTAGLFDTQTQGLLSIDGQLYTFAPKGSTITHTGDVATLVETLYFDVPDLCTGPWELVDAQVFDGYAVAWIRHDFPSATYPKILHKHAWDGLLYAPTFCQDPAIPGSFSPSIADIADQEYDAAFIPAMAVGVSKDWTSDLTGNAYSSRTLDPRVMNRRSLDSFKSDGEWYCFVVPEGAGINRDYVLPRAYADLMSLSKFVYFILEKATATGWVKVNYYLDEINPISGWYSLIDTVSRFAGGYNEAVIRIKWNSADAGIIRMRLVPSVTAVDVTQVPAVYLTKVDSGYALNIGNGKMRYRYGKEVDLPSKYIKPSPLLSDGLSWFIYVTSTGYTQITREISVRDNPSPIIAYNDYEKIRITHLLKTPVAGLSYTISENINWPTGVWTALSGTVSVTAGIQGMTGTSTTFLAQALAGALVRLNGVDENRIKAIASNTYAETDGGWPNTLAGATAEVDNGKFSTFQDGVTKIHVSVGGSLHAQVIGEYVTINAIEYQIAAIEDDILGASTRRVLILTKLGVHGDYTADLNSGYTFLSTNKHVITPFEYEYQKTDSDWYVNLILEYTDLAGDDDTLLLNTSSHDNTGKRITAISTINNRMLIAYADSSQLWQVDQDSNATRWLETVSFGTGEQASPSPTLFNGTIVMPTPRGWRSFYAYGNNLDSLRASNIGEALDGIVMPDIRGSLYWPHIDLLVIATQAAGVTTFYCLTYSRESKINAWVTWQVDDLASIPRVGMVSKANNLYFRAGHTLRTFNADASVKKDAGEADDMAFLSDVLFHYNDFGAPGLSKRYTAFDIVQVGSCEVAFQIMPYGASNASPASESVPIAVIGQTYGFQRRGIAMNTPAVAPRLRSRDITGWTLQRLAIDYVNQRR